MALSNWATLAVDHKGNAISGVFVSKRKALLGIRVEFYKNWIYVYDEKGWNKHSGYVKPCVMEIQEGDINYKGIRIKAVRGPKNGIYAVVIDGWKGDRGFRAMAGIGCYGWGENIIDDSEDGGWVGVEQEEEQFLFEQLEKWDMVGDKKEFKPNVLKKALQFNQGNMFFSRHIGTPLGASPVTK